MSVVRCFALYDYNKEFFYCFIRRGFTINTAWSNQRNEIEKKIIEIKKKPEEGFEMQVEYGTVRGVYDRKNKHFFILLSNPKAEAATQIKLLEEIFSSFESIQKLTKMTKDEVEKLKMDEIRQRIDMHEADYIKTKGDIGKIKPPKQRAYRKEVEAEIQKSKLQPSAIAVSFKDLASGQLSPQITEDELLRAFRCVFLYDYTRSFFYMFIRRGFPIEKSWHAQRVELEKYLLTEVKAPPKVLLFEGDYGIFRGKYEEKTKTYFIVLTRTGIEEAMTNELIEEIYQYINVIPKYNTILKEDLEGKHLKKVTDIVCKYEDQYQIKNHVEVTAQKQEIKKRTMIRENSVRSLQQTSIINNPEPQSIIQTKKSIFNAGSQQKIEFQIEDDYIPGEIEERYKLYSMRYAHFGQQAEPLDQEDYQNEQQQF